MRDAAALVIGQSGRLWAHRLAASVLALLDRRARHASLALLLAPSRYVNWALQTREAVAAGPHPFPLFALAAACEALRIAYGHAYALHGKRWRFPNAVPLATACLETVAFLRAALASRLLFTRWLRAPQLVQGACFALGAVLRYRRHSDQAEWIGGERTIVGRVYAPDDQGEKVDVDLEGAPGRWRRSEATFRIADGLERVKIQGAMREVCASTAPRSSGWSGAWRRPTPGDARVAVEQPGRRRRRVFQRRARAPRGREIRRRL